MFRDSQVWHGRNINQVDKFFEHWEAQKYVKLRYVLLEGDSKDDTFDALLGWQQRLGSHKVFLTKRDVGGSAPDSSGSVADRYRCLSEAGNACLHAGLAAGTPLMVWAESDLAVKPMFMDCLLEITWKSWWADALAVAPVTDIRLNGRQAFYDTWAFEGIDGETWGNHGSSPADYDVRYRPMRSIGSLALLNAGAAREHRLDFGTKCFRGLCEAGRAVGLDVYCDTWLHVTHPSNECVAGRWI